MANGRSRAPSLSKYIAREDNGFLTLTCPDDGEVLALNRAGRVAMVLLSEGSPNETIVELLSELCACDRRAAEESLRSFVADLGRYGLEFECSSPAGSPCPLELPRIAGLEDIIANGKQCPTFGMPKRSCRGLPSGVLAKGDAARVGGAGKSSNKGHGDNV